MEDFGYRLLPAVNVALDFMTQTVIPGVISVLENMGKAIGRVIDNHFNPLMDSIKETGTLLGLNFHIEEGTYWDNVFRPITNAIDTATNVLKLFNEAYKELLRLTGQPIPGQEMAPRVYVDPSGNIIPIGTGSFHPSGNNASTTVTTTVNIGTEKVDTVVSNSLRRIGPGGRNQ